MSSRLPSKIIAVAKNYAAHAREMGGSGHKAASPAFFLKPASSIIHVGSSIQRPSSVSELHFEVELGVVLGERCSHAAAGDWRRYVAGYCLGLDMTARCLQAAAKKAGLPWTRAKCFDSFTPLSHVVSAELVQDPHALELWLAVDGVQKQRGSTGDMLATVPELLADISRVMTLEAGDVILTGTPEGVGAVLPGQTITAGITGLLEVAFPVVQGR